MILIVDARLLMVIRRAVCTHGSCEILVSLVLRCAVCTHRSCEILVSLLRAPIYLALHGFGGRRFRTPLCIRARLSRRLLRRRRSGKNQIRIITAQMPRCQEKRDVHKPADHQIIQPK